MEHPTAVFERQVTHKTASKTYTAVCPVCGKGEKGTGGVKPPLEAFDEQMGYDKAAKTYTARCAVCGKAISVKKAWYRSKDATIEKLRLNFSCCDKCGKWVCENCFLIDDGNCLVCG
jgi:hypothetical protein